MRLFLREPSPPLRGLVEMFTYFEDHTPGHAVERLFPEGVVEIIIDLTGTPKFVFDNDDLRPIQECRNSWVSGVRTAPISISAGGESSSMFIIRLRPGASFPVLRMPVDELKGGVISGSAMFGRSIDLLRERLLEARTPDMKFRIVERFIIDRISAGGSTPEVVRFAVNRVLSSPRNGVIADVLKETGISHKHLITQFRNHVGIPPLSFVRLIRFQRALADINKTERIDWTGIALDCGYYDQSHFINDFRRFSGFTPGEYRLRVANDPNYVPVG